jgi:hypothetical protein
MKGKKKRVGEPTWLHIAVMFIIKWRLSNFIKSMFLCGLKFTKIELNQSTELFYLLICYKSNQINSSRQFLSAISDNFAWNWALL